MPENQPAAAPTRSTLIQPSVADMVIVCASAPGFNADDVQPEFHRTAWSWLRRSKQVDPRSRGINLLIWGEPGIGKTQLVTRTLKRIGRTLYKKDLSKESPEELKGIPRVIKEKGQLYTVDAPNRFLVAIARDPNAALALDDLTNASQGVQAAGLGLVLDKEFEDGKGGTISIKHAPIIGMANHGAAAALTELLAPAANRWVHVWTTANEDAQKYWERKDTIQVDPARAQTIDGEWNVLYAKAWAFCSALSVRYKPSFFERQPQEFINERDYAWCTPRSLELCARIIAACEHFGVDDTRLIEGAIGRVAARKLFDFRRELALPKVDDVWAGRVNWRALSTSQRVLLLHEAAKEAADEAQLDAVLGAMNAVRSISAESEDLVILAKDMLVQRARGVMHSRPMNRDLSSRVEAAFPDVFGGVRRAQRDGGEMLRVALAAEEHPAPPGDGWPVPRRTPGARRPALDGGLGLAS